MSSKWHYRRHDKQVGPFSSAELVNLAASGQISPNDLVWKEGMAAWAPARSVKGLFKSAAPSAPVAPLADARPPQKDQNDDGEDDDRPRKKRPDYEDEDDDQPRKKRRDEGNPLRAPAICLIVTGVILAIGSLFGTLYALNTPSWGFANEFINTGEKATAIKSLLTVLGIVELVLSLATIVGGITMVIHKGYGMSIAGAICTLVGGIVLFLVFCPGVIVPVFGIWALVVLRKPEVKRLFAIVPTNASKMGDARSTADDVRPPQNERDQDDRPHKTLRDEDHDLDDDRPHKKRRDEDDDCGRRSRKRNQQQSSARLFILLGIGGLCVLGLICGGVLWVVFGGSGGGGSKLALKNGEAMVESSLTDKDPKDTVIQSSYCKAFTIKLESGKTYQIDMKSKKFNSLLRLEDSANKQLDQEDDSGGDRGARIVFRCAKDDNYRIIATKAPGLFGNMQLPAGAKVIPVNQTGPFTLTVCLVSPPPNGGGGGVPVEPVLGGGSGKEIVLTNGFVRVDSSLTTSDPMDLVHQKSRCKAFKIKLKSGKIYQIDMKSTTIHSDLWLQDSAGISLADSSLVLDDPFITDARIVFRCVKDDTYRIIARTFDIEQGAMMGIQPPLPNRTGPFTLTVKQD